MQDERALERVAELHRMPGTNNGSGGPQHRGTIHICPDFDTLEHAYDDAKYGEPSRTPILE